MTNLFKHPGAIACVILVFLVPALIRGQDDTGQDEQPTTPQEFVEDATENPNVEPRSNVPASIAPQTNHVFVIFADSDPGKIIVLDQTGQWMPHVRSVTINMVLGTQATCSCIMWIGPYKPSKPFEKTWPLKQARSVSEEEFRQIVDRLQSDPMAVANG